MSKLKKIGGGLARKTIPFKKMRKIYKGAAGVALAASMIDEIGAKSHGGKWDIDYYDTKFAMISSQITAIQLENKIIMQHLEEV